MQHNDSKELSVELKNEYKNQSDVLLHKLTPYLERVSHALADFEELNALNKEIRSAILKWNKPFFVSKFQKKYEKYLVTLKMAEEAQGILVEEKRDIIFYLYPELSKARKLLSEIIATKKDLDILHSEAEEEFGDNSNSKAEVSGANDSKFEETTQDVIKEILKFLGLSDLAQMRLVSKKHKVMVDDLLSQPANVITAVDKLQPNNAMDFLDFYMQSQRYIELRKKFDETPEKLSSLEMICIALTTTNIYELHADDLDCAVKASEKVLSKALAENLRIMSNLIRLKQKAENPAESDKFLAQLQKQFNGRLGEDKKYMNIQSADLPQGLRYFGGVNFKNAKFHEPIDNLMVLVTREAFGSEGRLLRRLNQLEKLLSNTNSKQRSKLQNLIIGDCYQHALVLFHSGLPNEANNFTADRQGLEAVINFIDFIQNRFPPTKKDSELSKAMGRFFTRMKLINGDPRDQLANLKKEIREVLQSGQKYKPSK